MSNTVTIATWNVNSLRVRLQQVLKWLTTHQPDVLALQETKVTDQDFPIVALRDAGYEVCFSGQKSYNGVAILSRLPIQQVETSFPGCTDTQRRLLIATLGPLRVLNLYVPNGASLDSEKYQYKLAWLAQLQDYLAKELANQRSVIVVGDFNIAPEDRDVYDPSRWEGHVLVSQPERQAFQQLIDLGLVDTFRLFHPEANHYSWWDYRAAAFRRNHGLRIDHILSTPHLSSRCVRCEIDKAPRSWEQPSDHVPVIATYENIN